MNAPKPFRESQGWVIFALFTLTVALLGGSSRHDAVQIAALRPIAALFMIPALYFLSASKLAGARPLIWLLGLWTVWTALQLVPLPPAMWQALPGRGEIARLDQLTGLEAQWRPISLVPTRGYNALAGMIVLVTAMLLALAIGAQRRALLLLIAVLALLDGALGLVQVALGPNNALYFYATTTTGAPVGLFANENHSAMFSALGMIVIAHLVGTTRVARDWLAIRLAYAPAFLLALLSILVSSSRFGFGLAILALVIAIYLAFPALRQRANPPAARPTDVRPSDTKPAAQTTIAARIAQSPQLVMVLFISLLAGLFGALYLFERLPGLQDLFRASVFEELRWQIWPTLEEMIGIYWLLGTGFGSFEDVYQIHERTGFMLTAYLNQAHNDWAQVVIEGGMPALLLVAALAAFVFRRLRSVATTSNGNLRELIFWLSLIAVICAASVVDYPLRTPLFQIVVAFGLLVLSSDAPEHSLSEKNRSRRPRSHRSRNRSPLRA